MNLIEAIIIAAAVEHIADYEQFVSADRAFDAGEFSDLLRRGQPSSVAAAYAVFNASGLVYDDVTGELREMTKEERDLDAYVEANTSYEYTDVRGRYVGPSNDDEGGSR